MAIKTFRGKSVNEALAQVKRELGPNAVILHTKTHKVGGIFGIGAHAVTEITATADATVARSVQSRPAAKPQTQERPRQAHPPREEHRPAARRELLEYARAAAAPLAAPSPAVPVGKDSFDLDPLDPLAALTSRRSTSSERVASADQPRIDRAKFQPATEEPEAVRRAPSADSHRREQPKVQPEQFSAASREFQQTEPKSRHLTQPSPQPAAAPAIEAELAALRRMVTEVLRTSRGGANAVSPDALTDFYAKLIENELAAELAEEVTASVREELNREELASPDVVRQAILRHLAVHIPVSRSLPSAGTMPDGRPLTIALIGPTGVGKTTTLAKLAATYKLRRGKRVGLVTCDTYRIAAVDQLRTYANIIGLPLKVALTPADMRQACEQLSDCDVILIDTAGRSQRDTGKIDELRQLIDAASPHQTHLVLSSTHSERVLAEAAAKFVDIQPDHVIFTKLDEAVSVGLVVNTLRRLNAKLSFVTTGQEVPDQIELGNADRIARLVVDGGAAR